MSPQFAAGQIYVSPQGVEEHIWGVNADGTIVSSPMPITMGAGNVVTRSEYELTVLLQAGNYALKAA